MSIEAMKQALEALKTALNHLGPSRASSDEVMWDYYSDAITSLRAAIEQMEKAEPAAWMWRRHTKTTWDMVDRWDSIEAMTASEMEQRGWEVVKFYTHHTPTPDEITKLREQLATTQAEAEKLKEQHHMRYRMWHDEAVKRQALQDKVEALQKVMQQAREALGNHKKISEWDGGRDYGFRAFVRQRDEAIAAIDAAMQPAADEAVQCGVMNAKVGAGGTAAEGRNDRVEGRDAALSRRVPSHDGLCHTVEE